MYACWILITPQDPFLYRNSVVYVFGDVTKSAGLQSLHQVREILLLVDFATLMAQAYKSTGTEGSIKVMLHITGGTTRMAVADNYNFVVFMLLRTAVVFPALI